MDRPLADMGRFATVVVDPPWPVVWFEGTLTKLERLQRSRKGGYQNKAPGYTKMEYETMTIQEIAALPIGEVLADDALVFLWATQGTLRVGFDVLDDWGLEYSHVMTWHKPWGPKPLNKPMYNSEFAIVGKRGRPKYIDEKMLFTSNQWPNPRIHSVKPEGFYDLLRRVTPVPRLDVFGRRRIAGFESWGSQAPEGPALPDHYQRVLLDG